MNDHQTPWNDAASPLDAESPQRLERSVSVDVCVIGGGIAGITTAYILAREGVVVAVLDTGIDLQHPDLAPNL